MLVSLPFLRLCSLVQESIHAVPPAPHAWESYSLILLGCLRIT